MAKGKVVFITATDTNVGKTVATAVFGVLLQHKGFDVGVMKPVQCWGTDIQILRKLLSIKDDPSLTNPYFAPEPLSPHLALRRAGIKFKFSKIKRALKSLRQKHDIVLVEGAGGLLVPLTDLYYNADLVRDLKAELVIVARLGLGTINHTLLTIHQARARGLNIKGLIFSDASPKAKSLPEKTNPQEIERLSGVRVLGTIPYLRSLTREEVLKKCTKIELPV